MVKVFSRSLVYNTIENTIEQNMQQHIGKSFIELHVDPAFTVVNFFIILTTAKCKRYVFIWFRITDN